MLRQSGVLTQGEASALSREKTCALALLRYNNNFIFTLYIVSEAEFSGWHLEADFGELVYKSSHLGTVQFQPPVEMSL